MQVLVVEDDRRIRELVTLHLELEGLTVDAVENGHVALERLATHLYDLVILDLMLPGVDGLTVCRVARRGGPNHDVPILMLTARRDESDKVLGLETGADDYLAKPFGIRELVARGRALLRRPRGGAADSSSERIVIGDLEIDPARQRVRANGREIPLTAHEFRLMHLLGSHPGIVFTREALLARVWPDGTHVTPRSVDTLVKRVRRALEEDPANPKYILTVWGTGYRFADV